MQTLNIARYNPIKLTTLVKKEILGKYNESVYTPENNNDYVIFVVNSKDPQISKLKSLSGAPLYKALMSGYTTHKY